MLTPEDIRNPKRKSGYDHVNSAAAGPRGGGKRQTWRGQAASNPAYSVGNGQPAYLWRGPTRLDPEEAAQDYCDYINGQRQSAAATPATLKNAGHEFEADDKITDPEYRAAIGVLRDFRAQREGRQGYIYLITDGEYVKIGYSVNPKKRVSELQTGNARLLHLLATIEGTQQDERDLHIQFINHNVLQEWFEIDSTILEHFGVAEEAATA